MRPILVLLVAFAVAICVSCSSVNDAISQKSINNLEEQTDPSDFAIREMFVESGLGEGDESLEELKKLPAERVAEVVKEIKLQGIREGDMNFGGERADELLRLKAAYFLVTLGVDAEANQEYLLRTARSKDGALKFRALELLAALVKSGKKELLPVFFEAAPDARGLLAESLAKFFVEEARNSTEPFLRYLSKQPKNVRSAVTRMIAGADILFEPGTAAETFAKAGAFKEDRELGRYASELLAANKSSKRSP